MKSSSEDCPRPFCGSEQSVAIKMNKREIESKNERDGIERESDEHIAVANCEKCYTIIISAPYSKGNIIVYYLCIYLFCHA